MALSPQSVEPPHTTSGPTHGCGIPPPHTHLTVQAVLCGADLPAGGVDAEHFPMTLLQDGEPQRRVVRLGVVGISGLHRQHAGPCRHHGAGGPLMGPGCAPPTHRPPPSSDPPGAAPSTTRPVKTSWRNSGRLSFWSTTMISRSVGSSSVVPPRSSAKAFSCGHTEPGLGMQLRAGGARGCVASLPGTGRSARGPAWR